MLARSEARAAAAIVLLGMAGAVGIGFARFAYSLILADMRADLGWGYSEAGFLNTLNALGYLAGAMAASRVMAAIGSARTLRVGMALVVASMALMLGPPQVALLWSSRIGTGLGAALAFVAGSTLAASIAEGHPAHRGTLIGLFYVGPGLGMAFSGATAPFVLAHWGAGSWRMAWAWLTVLGFALSLPAFFSKPRIERTPQQAHGRERASSMRMVGLLLGYGAFAAGVIAYMTFVIAWVRDAGGSYALQAEFWTTIGLAAVASPWLWGRLMDSLDGGRATAALIGVSGIGAAVPLWFGVSAATLLESAILFGSAVFAVVAATTVFVRRNYPREAWGAAIGALTVAWGVGQAVGPVAMGVVSDWFGTRGLHGALWVSLSFLAVGLAICAAQPEMPSASE